MKIDKEKLIELLVEKTSMEKEEIENQLDQLIDRILDAAKRGKALEIKEFGLFYFDETGELKFEPAKELSTEISFKYAGMKPVELKPERDTSISELEDQDEKEEDEDEMWSELEDEKFDDVAPFEPDNTEIGIEDDESEDEKSDILEDPFALEEIEPLEETETIEKKEPSVAKIKPSFKQPVRKQKNNAGVYVALAIVIIAVIVGGYYYFTQTRTETPPSDSSMMSQQAIPEESQQQDQGGEMDDMSASGRESVENRDTESEQMPGEAIENELPDQSESQGPADQTEETPGRTESVSPGQTVQPMYGLMGTATDEANNGYSIVIHSFTSEASARSVAQDMRQKGYRVIVTSRVVAGNSVWRVSLGQFESLEAAQRATVQLPDPYRTQNFIQRIQIN